MLPASLQVPAGSSTGLCGLQNSQDLAYPVTNAQLKYQTLRESSKQTTPLLLFSRVFLVLFIYLFCGIVKHQPHSSVFSRPQASYFLS